MVTCTMECQGSELNKEKETKHKPGTGETNDEYEVLVEEHL